MSSIKTNYQDRNNILTPQEHKLFGSTVEPRTENKPYTPIAVQLNQMSVEECNRLREKRKEIKNVFASYWQATNTINCDCSIEPLDTNPESRFYGQTLDDPALIRIENESITTKLIDWSNKFPYQRTSPRIHTHI